MSGEDLENFESDAQMALYEEYKNVFGLFTYVVETDKRFYLCNSVDVQPRADNGMLFFEVAMADVWVWDIFRPSRFMKNVKIFSVKDINVEERSTEGELIIPEMPNFDE
ncbi:DUF2469 family protein [Rothia sp. ND6WE1A]|uniref:DUF2469 family protein n=1 Tax=Rothia sp. ND6WE1A TaxID=1848190 RepID=UPI00083397EC|nr:DUF2469 family protein [Rothia sp. ND6WE1A]